MTVNISTITLYGHILHISLPGAYFLGKGYYFNTVLDFIGKERIANIIKKHNGRYELYFVKLSNFEHFFIFNDGCDVFLCNSLWYRLFHI